MNPESQQDQKKTRRPRKYPEEFRQHALERMETCDNIAGLARELGVRRKWLYKWRDQVCGRVPESESESRSANKPKPRAEDRERKRLAELERLVARQALEMDFFKGALQRIEELRRKREQTSGAASTSKSGK